MKLYAEVTQYSSIVGGGILLTDNIGHAKFNIMLTGTTQGITKEQNDSMAKQIAALINKYGLVVES